MLLPSDFMWALSSQTGPRVAWQILPTEQSPYPGEDGIYEAHEVTALGAKGAQSGRRLYLSFPICM